MDEHVVELGEFEIIEFGLILLLPCWWLEEQCWWEILLESVGEDMVDIPLEPPNKETFRGIDCEVLELMVVWSKEDNATLLRNRGAKLYRSMMAHMTKSLYCKDFSH